MTTPDQQQQLISQFEEAAQVEDDYQVAAVISRAISLKRIADALDKIISTAPPRVTS
jgi:hypothetical protein